MIAAGHDFVATGLGMVCHIIPHHLVDFVGAFHVVHPPQKDFLGDLVGVDEGDGLVGLRLVAFDR